MNKGKIDYDIGGNLKDFRRYCIKIYLDYDLGMMDLRINIVLGILCLFLGCQSFSYEINGNNVTQTQNGGTRIELSNPMHLNSGASIGSAKPEILPTNMSTNILPTGSPLQRKVPHIGWKIISNQNNLNLSPYLSNLVVNIDKNLPKDENPPTGQMKVNVKILKNGTLSDIKVVESSYNKEYENKIIKAVETTQGEPLRESGFKPVEIGLLFATQEKQKLQSNFVEPDFGPYMRELQKRIKANWNPPVDYRTKRVTVLFKVEKSGRLASCSVFQSSGNKDADKAAVDAIYKTAPFRPLPSEYSGKSVDIQFTFDYNVFGASRDIYKYSR